MFRSLCWSAGPSMLICLFYIPGIANEIDQNPGWLRSDYVKHAHAT